MIIYRGKEISMNKKRYELILRKIVIKTYSFHRDFLINFN